MMQHARLPACAAAALLLAALWVCAADAPDPSADAPSDAAVREAGATEPTEAGASNQGDPAGPDATGARPEVRRVVFAAPFTNETQQEQYDPAAAGLADLVAVLLARQEQVRVVERQRLRALAAEQARRLRGLTGRTYALQAGRLLEADTVLVGRLFLVEGKLTVSVAAVDLATSRVAAAEQLSCRPTYLAEAALQLARRLGRDLSLPLPEIDLKEIDTSPIASLHFAKGLSRYYGGNLDRAIMQFMRAVDLDPDYVEAHYWMGMAYQRLGEDAHAIIEWEAFLERQPAGDSAAQARTLLAEAKERQKDSPVERLGPPKTPTDASEKDDEQSGPTAPPAGGGEGQAQ